MVLSAVAHALGMYFLQCVLAGTIPIYFFVNVSTPSGEKRHQRGPQPPQASNPLRRKIISPHSACIFYIITFCVSHVFATDICVTNMCTESSGGVAVFLTGTTP